MGNIVLLTGAGASKPLGFSTTTECFSDEPNEINRTYKEIAQWLGKSSPDVEEVLQFLQPIDDFLGTNPGRFVGRRLSDDWGRRVPAFTEHVRRKCFHHYGKRPDEKAVRQLYEELLELSGWRRYAIDLFTANYDPVTDVLLDIAKEQGLRAYDGFGLFARWEPDLFDWSEPGIKVFRLHGSMSWIRDGNRIFNSRDYNLRESGPQKHLLIYPGFKGDPERDHLDEVFQFTQMKLRTALKSSSALVAIGYSFRDQAINDAIREAMDANSGLRILVLNPQWPEGIDNVMKILQQKQPDGVLHVDKKFGTAEAILAIKNHLGTT